MQYLTWAYVILIYAFLPLFMRYGYFELGEHKGLAYLYINAGATVVMLIAMAVKGDLKRAFSRKNSNIRTYAGAAFLLTNLVTFIFAQDKKVSFLGLHGWRMGFATVFFMVFFMVFFANYVKADGYLLAAMLVTPAVEFVLGILNRFQVYPVEIFGQNDSFLATIGNINWYTGFLSIFVPLGMGLLTREKTFSLKYNAALIYTAFGLMALLTQGSDSAVLVIAASYGALLLFSLGDREKFRGFLLQITVLGAVMELAGVLTTLLDEWYVYNESLTTRLCHAHIGLILVAAALLFYRLSRLFEEIKMPWKEKTYERFVLLLAVVAVIVGVVLLIGSFDYSFGNDRGLIWSISLDVFKSMSPWQKLVGVGQDGFYGFAYSDPVLAESLLNVFNGNQLTNAHCELLTMLVERGLLGVFSYLVLLAVAIRHFWQNKRERNILLFALPVIAYFCNGLVSFNQIMSTPYFFMMLGMGISLSNS